MNFWITAVLVVQGVLGFVVVRERRVKVGSIMKMLVIILGCRIILVKNVLIISVIGMIANAYVFVLIVKKDAV